MNGQQQKYDIGRGLFNFLCVLIMIAALYRSCGSWTQQNSTAARSKNREENYRSSYCDLRKNDENQCGACPGPPVMLNVPQGEPGKAFEVETAPTCFTRIAWAYGHWMEMELNPEGYTVRVPSTGEVFWVPPGQKGKTLWGATLLGNTNYLDLSGTGTLRMTVK